VSSSEIEGGVRRCGVAVGVNAEAIRQMMTPDPEGSALWAVGELRDLFRHQLDAPLAFDFAQLDAARGQLLRELTRGAVPPPLHSFRDLLHHPRPPVELLYFLKEFSKAARTNPDAPLPAEIATALYYAGIAAALLRAGGVRITTMDDPDLATGFRWALEQPWADEQTRALFRDALGVVMPAGGNGADAPT